MSTLLPPKNHRHRSLALPLILALAPVSASAADPGSILAPRLAPNDVRIDPLLRAKAPRLMTPMMTPVERDGQWAATIRIDDAAPTTLRLFEAQGINFRRGRDGSIRHVGPIYPVRATRTSLATIARAGLQVEVTRERGELAAIETGHEVQVPHLQAIGATPTDGPTGEGLVIADIDAPPSVFHPHFFKADAGAYDWIDFDDNGVFDPGVDGVDTNGDGVLDPFERLLLLDHATHRYDWLTEEFEYLGSDGVFDPEVDYIYLDLDEDGARSFGAPAYSDNSPGFGEPIFLPDDANGDGILQPEERILMLGTSRILAVYDDGFVYKRGENLIHFTGPESYRERAHGTSVGGILVGGQERAFRRHRGLAPDAELVYGLGLGNDHVDIISWVKDNYDIAVMLHEIVYTGGFLDGSSGLETAVAASTSEGTPHVCLAGNFGWAKKHAIASVNDGSFSVSWTVPEDGGALGELPSYVNVWTRWIAPSTFPECLVSGPSGVDTPLELDQVAEIDGTPVELTIALSSRDTNLLKLSIMPAEGVPDGMWTMTCEGLPGDVSEAYSQVFDGSLWGTATTMVGPTLTSTLTSPATSDECIRVGAYAGQSPDPSAEVGELRGFSSQGPRIDGKVTVDLTAPDDPFAPYPHYDDWSPNLYKTFSGTSGSATFVTAAAALMRQLDPSLGHAEIRAMLREHSEADAPVQADDNPDAWGVGKLRAYRSFTGEDPAPSEPWRNAWLSVDYASVDGACTATVTVEDERGESTSARWDDDYDGVWETDFEELSRVYTLTENEPDLHLRVDVAVDGWIVGGAALVASAPDACLSMMEGETTGATETDSGGETYASDGDDGTQTGTDSGGQDDVEEGCGCRARGEGGNRALFAVLLAIAWTRRRRPSTGVLREAR